MLFAFALLHALLVGGTAQAQPHAVATATVGVAPPVSAAALHAFGDARAGAMQSPPVQIWVDERADLFSPGDAVRLRFRTGESAYVAVFHLDTEGNLELLYPRSAREDGFVRAGRVYSLSGISSSPRLSLGRTPGIGYFYIVASRDPLDLRFLHSRLGWQVEVWGAHGAILGDPFWALERLTYRLVPDWRRGHYAVDIYGYHLGGRHRFPTYVCYDGFARYDPWARYPYYLSCSDVTRLLVRHPHYYDPRRYRGDRAVYLRELEVLARRHGYKEPPGAWPAGVPRRADVPPRATTTGERGVGVAPTRDTQQTTEAATPVTPARQRPALERRPSEGQAAPAARPTRPAAQPTRPSAQPASPPRQNPPARPAQTRPGTRSP